MLNQSLGENKSETVDVKEYLAVLLKRKWLVLVCFLLSMACTTAFLFTRQPIYRANAKLFVSTLGDVPSVEVVQENPRTFYDTAIVVIQSQSMLHRVQLRMHKTPEEIRENLAGFRVNRLGGAEVMVVSVDSPSRDFARDFANAVCEEYLRFREEERAKYQESALLGLTREINKLSQEVKAANERIVMFARQNKVALLEGDPQLGQSKYLQVIHALNQAAVDVANVQARKNYLDAQPDSTSVVAMLTAQGSAAPPDNTANTEGTAESRPLGVGSVINIQVDQAPDRSIRTTIGADGMIDFGSLGKVQGAGLTPAALATKIQRLLAQEAQINSPVHVTSPTPALATAGAVTNLPLPTGDQGTAVPAAELNAQQNRNAAHSWFGVLPELRTRKIFDLESQRRDLQAKLNEMGKIYRPKHPAFAKVQTALNEVVARIDDEVNFLRQTAADDLRLAKERYQKLQASLDSTTEDAMNINASLQQIVTLRSDAARVQSLYTTLLGQLLKVDVLDRATKSVSVLEYAIVENEPIYPKKVKGLLMATFIGLGLGLALAYFIEYIDDSIKLAEEVERDLQLPFLGMIPAAQWSPTDLTAHRLDKLKQQGGVAEAYRVVRSAILFSTPRDKLRSILLTSAVPREGKTTTCVNLSIGFAQIEERVLLIDADLRRGETHKYFGFDREKGLADVLLGEVTPEQAVRHTGVPKLDVITSGTYPANPAELLLGWRLKELFDWAHKNYDRIIIDCPPIMGIADSAILGAAVDGVAFIIWAGRTSRRYVRVAKMTAVSRGAKIFGFILNNLEPGRVGYYHYYPYYYSYYSRGYYYARPKDDGKGGEIKGIEVPTPEGGEEKIDDVY